jgi:hypothetical protein
MPVLQQDPISPPKVPGNRGTHYYGRPISIYRRHDLGSSDGLVEQLCTLGKMATDTV